MHREKFGGSRVKFSKNFIASLLNTYKKIIYTEQFSDKSIVLFCLINQRLDVQ